MSAPSQLRTPWLPRLVVAPSFLVGFLFIYGLIAWNGYLSVSESRLLPNYEFAGLQQYAALFDSERFHVALEESGRVADVCMTTGKRPSRRG